MAVSVLPTPLGPTNKNTPIGRRDRAIICLMFYCGLRSVSVHHADIGDLEEREGREVLWSWGKARDGKDDYNPLPVPAENALREWLAVRPGSTTGPLFTDLNKGPAGRRMSKNAIRTAVRLRMRRIGIRF